MNINRTIGISVLVAVASFVASPLTARSQCDDNHYLHCQSQLGLYVTGQLGRADSDTSPSSLNTLYNLQGIDATSVAVDESDSAFSLGFGYQITPMVAIEATFLDLGERDVRFTGTTVDPVAFARAANVVYPETAEGFTLGVVLSYPLSEKLKIAGKVGVFDWENEYETGTNVGNPVRSYTESSNAWIGGELQYRYSDSTQLFLSVSHYDLIRDDNQMLSAGIRYFIDAKTSSQPVTPAPQVVKEMPVAAPVVVIDSDKDGVADSIDQCADTPIEHQVEGSGCSILAEQFVDYALVIRFERNSDIIADEYQQDLNEMVEFINTYKVKELTVYGHTSAVGAASYNQGLSQKRAESLRQRLINEYGVNADIKAVGKGETELLNQEDIAEAHAENRRVELSIRERLVVPTLK